MSQGILGKDGNGWAKADVATSRTLANSFKAVVATHRSVGGETAINMLSLTSAAGDLPGFVQPNASEIQAARPYMMPGTFRLRSSLRGALTMYAHFILNGNQINFTTAFGSTLVNEIFLIEITPIPANNLLVSDGRQFDTGSFEQAVGNATVNVGYSFTASDFLVVIRNNQILDENLDFTRVIGSTGTGSTLTLLVAPTGSPDNMRIYGGIFFGNASVELFTQLERVQAAVQLLAVDASNGFYGDSLATRYLSAAPAEIDRMAFGALVTSLQAQVAALQNFPACCYYLSANFTTSTTIPINFDTKDFDLQNSVVTSPTGWKFTANSPGVYQISTFCTGITSAVYTFSVYKNGVYYRALSGDDGGTSKVNGTLLMQLNANDFIDLRGSSSVTIGGGTPAAGANFTPSYISIRRAQ